MTFSIVGHCPETGMFGLAISSSSPAVAARCAFARAGVGAVSTQNVTDPRLGPRTLNLMEQGATPGEALAILERTGGRLAEEPLGHGYKELTIPAADEGGGRFRMERGALHIWPRGEYMLIALPNLDGSFTATLFLPNQGDESFQALTTTEAVYALFERRFADVIPLMPRLGEEFFENPTGHLETIR